MRKYLPVSELAGCPPTLFPYTFTIVFTGICRVLLCLEFPEASLIPPEGGFSTGGRYAIFAGGLPFLQGLFMKAGHDLYLEASLTSTVTVIVLSATSSSPSTGAMLALRACLPGLALLVFQLKVISSVFEKGP